MTAPPTMSVKLLQSVIDSAEQLGADRAEVVRLAGLADADLSDPDGRAPLAAGARLDAVLRERLGPSAAIRLGEATAATHATVLSYLIENCDDLGQAFRAIHQYRSIAMELTPPVLDVAGDAARFGCSYPPMFVSKMPGTIELRLTYWLAKTRNVTGVDWTPTEVHLQTRESDPSSYERVFRCPVIDSAPRTQLVFDAALLNTPIVGADSNLRYFLTPIAEEILSRLPRKEGFLRKVQSCIAEVLKDGESQLEKVAGKLNVSTRTLQRRLEEEDTSFGALLDEARRVAAIEYLKDQRVSITDTAYLLGFSEPSTFYRAFKRWTGTTPANYRRSAIV